MRILLLEMKRVIRSRMTWILLLIAVALSVTVSLRVVSYAEYTDTDGSGKEVTVSGTAAIHGNKKQMQPYEGPVTEAKLQNALKTVQNAYKQYGEGIPMEVVRTKLNPIDHFLQMIHEVYPRSGDFLEALSQVSPDEITNFYQQRTEALEGQLEGQYPGNQDVLRQAQRLNEKEKTPFVFHYGYTADASDNLEILIFLLVLICAMIVSPVFSAEYQNGSDDILRCTRHGRGRLAILKVLSALILTCGMFAVCALAFVLIVDTAYGWESLRTSAQVLTSALSLAPLSVGQEQIFTLVEGLLMVLAVACLTLFISAKCRNSTTTLIIAMAFCILPLILNSLGKGNLINWINCVLPAGGASMLNSFYYQLNKTLFIQMGPFSVWAPVLMAGAAVVEIPLFFILAVHAYDRHQAA